VIDVEESFDEGTLVGIFNSEKAMIGKGITNYSSEDIERIKGQKTGEIKGQIDKRFFEEIIHRDNMVIL
jgi:glutamate 5-kinase